MTSDEAFWFCMGALGPGLLFLAYLLFGPHCAEVRDTPTFPDDHNIEVKEANHDHH